jgi:hypothetical protein
MGFPSAMPLQQPFLPQPQPQQKIQFGVKQPVHPSAFDFGNSRRQDWQRDKQLKHAPAQAPRLLGMSNVMDENEEERREQRASRFAVQARAVHQSGNADSFKVKNKSGGNFDAEDDIRDDNETTALESKLDLINGDGSVVGSCEDMCPAQERQRRESMSDIQIFERPDLANPALTSAELAVKRFARTVDDPKPSDFRTRAALQKTMNHLRGLLDRMDVRFGLVHKFLWDRYRSVRQDLYIQGITDGFAIGIFEEIVRFHIMCEHELCGEDQSVTDMEGFNSHLNLEQMNKALISLNDMYDKATASGSPVSESEPEFRAYHLVSLMAQHGKFKGDQQAFLSTLQALRPEVRNSPALQWVLKLRASFVSGNFAKYFSLVHEAPYLLACLAHIYFGTMRIKAFKVISETFSAASSRPSTLEISWLRRMLGFFGEVPCSTFMDMDGGNGNVCEDDSLLVSTATACGFAFAEPTANQGDEKYLVVAKSQFVEPQAPLPRRPAAWISSKSPPQRSACVVVPFGSGRLKGEEYSRIAINEQHDLVKGRVEGDVINEQKRRQAEALEEQKEALRRRQQLEMQAAAQEKERREKEEAAAAAGAAAEAETRRQLELKVQARREEEARLKLEMEMAREKEREKEKERARERKRREEEEKEKKRKERELELERQRLEAERRRLEEERKRIEVQKALEEEMARRRRQEEEEAAARKLQEAVELVRVKVLQRRYVSRWLENASRMATQRAREQRMAASLKACRVGIFQPPPPLLPSSPTGTAMGAAMGTATKQAEVSLDLRQLIASTLKSMMVADTVDEFTDVLFWKVTVVDGAGFARATTAPSPKFRQLMARLQNDSGMIFCSSFNCYRSRIDLNVNVDVNVGALAHIHSARWASKSISIAIGVTGTSSLERSDAFHGSNGIIVVWDEIGSGASAKETRDYIKDRLSTTSVPGVPLPPVLILAKDSTTTTNKMLSNVDVGIAGRSPEELRDGLCWLINRGISGYPHPLSRHIINASGRDSLDVLRGPRVVPLERLLREALDAALEGCRSVYSMPFQVTVTYPTHLPMKMTLEVLVKAVDEAFRSPEAVGQWPPRELCCDNYLQGEAGGKAVNLCNWFSVEKKSEIFEVFNEIDSLIRDGSKQSVDIKLETHELVAFYCHSVISNVLEERLCRGLAPLVVVLPPREASVLSESLHKLRSMHGVSALLGKSAAAERVESPRKRKRSPPPLTRVGLQLLINEVHAEVQAEKKACTGLLRGAARVGTVVSEIEMAPSQMAGDSDVDKSQRDDSVIFRNKLQRLGDAIREERRASQSVWRKLYGAIASAVGLM